MTQSPRPAKETAASPSSVATTSKPGLATLLRLEDHAL
jgi:hypothetical protein